MAPTKAEKRKEAIFFGLEPSSPPSSSAPPAPPHRHLPPASSGRSRGDLAEEVREPLPACRLPPQSTGKDDKEGEGEKRSGRRRSRSGVPFGLYERGVGGCVTIVKQVEGGAGGRSYPFLRRRRRLNCGDGTRRSLREGVGVVSSSPRLMPCWS